MQKAEKKREDKHSERAGHGSVEGLSPAGVAAHNQTSGHHVVEALFPDAEGAHQVADAEKERGKDAAEAAAESASEGEAPSVFIRHLDADRHFPQCRLTAGGFHANPVKERKGQLQSDVMEEGHQADVSAEDEEGRSGGEEGVNKLQEMAQDSENERIEHGSRSAAPESGIHG